MKVAFIRRVVLGILLAVVSLGAVGARSVLFPEPVVSPKRLAGHVPFQAMAAARWKGHLPASRNISLSIAMPLRNQAELLVLLDRLYDPADTLYGQYVSPQEFADRFGPTQEDYDTVAAYVQSLGLLVTGIHTNRALLNVSGSAATVEAAFNLHLHRFETENGREFFAPDDDPEIPDSVASRIVGIVGLDNAAVWHSHSQFIPASELAQAAPYQVGTGPGGGLTPGDISIAYNLNGVAANGAGQTLGLFELDGYNPSDISAYVGYYGLRSVPLQNVLVDGFSGAPGSGAAEVTLDIELQIALAPGTSGIIVYEGPNSNAGVVDTYNRIATDNRARQISTSWGLSEGQSSAAVISAENTAFMQMAAQGQSIYAASGDSGAYDNGSTLSVDDPASQPYMVGVGGTQISLNADRTYNHETTWNVNNTISGGAGGGGISSLWTIPAWQQGVVSGSSLGSTVMRNVPDVSLNASQYTGYSVYFQGKWWIYGGTSCAAPLWASFTALVNQQRAANGGTPLGFANPTLYQIARGPRYGADFHDIADGSTNIYYPAVSGYDAASGWGSFNGTNLLSDLSATAPPVSLSITSGPSASPGKMSATINWSTNLASNSVVSSGTSQSNLNLTSSNVTLVTSHSLTLSGLSRKTTYYYLASSSAGGSTVASSIKSFTTR